MPKLYGLEEITSAKNRLKLLPGKPKSRKSVPLFEAVRQMKSEIIGALKRGYSFDDIVLALKDDGIDVGIPTLKSYVYRKPSKPDAKAARVEPKQKNRSTAKVVAMSEDL